MEDHMEKRGDRHDPITHRQAWTIDQHVIDRIFDLLSSWNVAELAEHKKRGESKKRHKVTRFYFFGLALSWMFTGIIGLIVYGVSVFQPHGPKWLPVLGLIGKIGLSMASVLAILYVPVDLFNDRKFLRDIASNPLELLLSNARWAAGIDAKQLKSFMQMPRMAIDFVLFQLKTERDSVEKRITLLNGDLYKGSSGKRVGTFRGN